MRHTIYSVVEIRRRASSCSCFSVWCGFAIGERGERKERPKDREEEQGILTSLSIKESHKHRVYIIPTGTYYRGWVRTMRHIFPPNLYSISRLFALAFFLSQYHSLSLSFGVHLIPSFISSCYRQLKWMDRSHKNSTPIYWLICWMFVYLLLIWNDICNTWNVNKMLGCWLRHCHRRCRCLAWLIFKTWLLFFFWSGILWRREMN